MFLCLAQYGLVWHYFKEIEQIQTITYAKFCSLTLNNYMFIICK